MGGPSQGCGSYRCRQRHDNYEEALRRYHPTEEEFLSWQRAFAAHGLPGLRATRIQQLAESRALRQLLLREAPVLPDSLDVSPDQFAHVHARQVSE
jgi:hypothetical protein